MVAKYTEQMDGLLKRDFKYGTHVVFTIDEYEQLQRENSVLRATVKALREELPLLTGMIKEICDASNLSWPMATLNRAENVLNKTESQPINDLKADAVEEFVEYQRSALNRAISPEEYAQKLREGSK